MLAHPFRFLPNRRAAALAEDSDAADAQEIAFLLLTGRGERPLAPEYGIADPAYDAAGVSEADIAAAIAAFGPPVTVDAVVESPVDGGMSVVEITFTR